MSNKHKSVSLNSNTKFRFHTLTAQLYKSLIQAYLKGGQHEYLARMRLHEEYNVLIKSKILFLLSDGPKTNSYQIIGGCFHPLFNLKSFKADSAVHISCFTKNHDIELRLKEKNDLEQEINDFILTDFITSISLLSLKKIGYVVKDINAISKIYKSGIWEELLLSEKEYISQTEFCKLLDVSTNTIHKHTQDST